MTTNNNQTKGETTMTTTHTFSDGTTRRCDVYPTPDGAYCWLCAYHHTHSEADHNENCASSLAAKKQHDLGTQLWEPCDRCGTEPSYARANGHLCKNCIGSGHDHPRINTAVANSVEPEAR
jgi:hypothetical protein